MAKKWHKPHNPPMTSAEVTCGKKFRYVSKTLALGAGRVANVRYGNGPRWVYKCKACKGWHLTSRPQPDPSCLAGTTEGETNDS